MGFAIHPMTEVRGILAKRLKQAFKETIDELRKPENVEKMASEIQGVIKKVEALKLNKKGGG